MSRGNEPWRIVILLLDRIGRLFRALGCRQQPKAEFRGARRSSSRNSGEMRGHRLISTSGKTFFFARVSRLCLLVRAAADQLNRGSESNGASGGQPSAVRPHAAACVLDLEDIAIEVGNPLPTLDRQLKIAGRAPNPVRLCSRRSGDIDQRGRWRS